jgi:hypothetical protein
MSKRKAPAGNFVGFVCNKCKRNFRIKEDQAGKITQCVYDDCKDKDIKRVQ